MIIGLNISTDEEKDILEKFKTWSKGFHKRFGEKGFNYVLEKYDRLVTSIELLSGIETSPRFLDEVEPFDTRKLFEEYINDLSARDAIQIILDSVSSGERLRLVEFVKDLDLSFKKLIIGNDFKLRRSYIDEFPKDIYWWYYGCPEVVKDL